MSEKRSENGWTKIPENISRSTVEGLHVVSFRRQRITLQVLVQSPTQTSICNLSFHNGSPYRWPVTSSLRGIKFAPFQCWLQMVVFQLKCDFLSNFELIVIILNLLLWVLYYTVKRLNAHFWTTLGCSFTWCQRKFNFSRHLYEFVI